MELRPDLPNMGLPPIGRADIFNLMSHSPSNPTYPGHAAGGSNFPHHNQYQRPPQHPRPHRGSHSRSPSRSRSPPSSHRGSHHDLPPHRGSRRKSRGSSGASYSGSEHSFYSSDDSRSSSPYHHSHHRPPRYHSGRGSPHHRRPRTTSTGRYGSRLSSPPPAGIHSSRSDLRRDPRDRSKREVWSNQVCILGEKVAGFKMHFCRCCNMPILRYSRLTPCKHIACLTCGQQLINKECFACRQQVKAVTTYEFGSLFVCEMSSSNSSDGLCHRGYCSARDLEAHHTFRHSKPQGGPSAGGGPSDQQGPNGVPVPMASGAVQGPPPGSAGLVPNLAAGLVGITLPPSAQITLPFTTSQGPRMEAGVSSLMSFPGTAGGGGGPRSSGPVMSNFQQQFLMNMSMGVGGPPNPAAAAAAAAAAVNLATAAAQMSRGSQPPSAMSRPF